MWKDVRRICANTLPFYIRDLSGFWYPRGSRNQSPEDTEG